MLSVNKFPFVGAVQTCNALVLEGHELLYISNRSSSSWMTTYAWLKDQLFPLEGCVLTCTMDDKRPHIADCQYLIDDRPKTLVEFVYDNEWERTGMLKYQGPRKAFGKAYPYNVNLTDIPNIYLSYTWAGINDYLVRKGVLSAPAHLALEV